MLKWQFDHHVEEPAALMDAIARNIERFVSTIRRGKLGARGKRSLSTTAACGMLDIMRQVVSDFREHEAQRESISHQMLRANCSADLVATQQVRRLMQLISLVGVKVLRAQFATLMLMNVTRRVLSLIREAALENMASISELEVLAAQQLNELEASDRHDSADNVQELQSSQPLPQLLEGGSPQGSLERSRVDSGPGPFSPSSALGSEERRQRHASIKALTVRFTMNTSQRDSIVELDATFEDDDRRTAGVLGVGIPGEQSLRRAPSRREEEDDERTAEFPVRIDAFFDSLLEATAVFAAEMEGMCDELCLRAPRQLHLTDIVITIGCSNTTQRYFLSALKAQVRFRVIILEGAPFPSHVTQRLATELRENGAEVQVLPDSSAFAVMGNCTKVLIGAESVLANGGLLATIGTHPLCIAAKHFAVPVLVATTTLKMSPYYPRDVLCTSLVKISRTDAKEIPWNTYGSPYEVLPTPYGENVENIGSLTINSPATEYVPPELVTLYATNESEYTPSQIHRIVRENYNPED
ncbi:putative translation initiation factor eif-2b beta subunit, putative,eIF-2B GDP-GTP exchange factor [Trypanosoma conorhini]|uniref:Translation initiation factor eIF2B subunit beta n=1 Tax=Trypanosoma conorhini TaxID=83891 RepID=A0A3R7L299_9TRYP|nr:putative translation initiation factor eif-2b beta subunit, putative,eIF-2B GDP-GTP exchange factor [Trypanosoma conorhini]RNF18208.1 putative translation initiation factor eif-2b beta subunit, putative,eIF-2B GDP-GTP exchange factor [Trypanosoma conorhini]